MRQLTGAHSSSTSGRLPYSYVGISDVEVGKRETCLSCEKAGRTTRLVSYGHWGICPKHEPQLMVTVEAFARLALMKQLINR